MDDRHQITDLTLSLAPTTAQSACWLQFRLDEISGSRSTCCVWNPISGGPRSVPKANCKGN